MIIELLYQDKFKFSFEESLFNKYTERLDKISRSSSIRFSQKKISEKKMFEEIDKNNTNGNYIVILDEKGKQLDTEKFKNFLFNSSIKKIIFLIGGTNGFSNEIIKKANLVISLSKMTLTHSFAAIILLEQIYRSATIKLNHPYHRK